MKFSPIDKWCCSRCGESRHLYETLWYSGSGSGWWAQWVRKELCSSTMAQHAGKYCNSCAQAYLDRHIALVSLLEKLRVLPGKKREE
jgi:hypothetical protein